MVTKRVAQGGDHYEFETTSYFGGLIVSRKGRYGGNVKFFGFPVYLYARQEDYGWFNQWTLTLPFVFAIRRVDSKNGTLKTLAHKPAGWSVSFAKLRISLHFIPPEIYQ